MDQLNSNRSQDQKELIQKAIEDIQSGLYRGTGTAARAYNISDSTLRKRMAGRNTRGNAHKPQQILSNAGAITLVRWITRLTCAGYPASPSLVVQMAEEVRRERIHLRNDTNASTTGPTDSNLDILSLLKYGLNHLHNLDLMERITMSGASISPRTRLQHG